MAQTPLQREISTKYPLGFTHTCCGGSGNRSFFSANYKSPQNSPSWPGCNRSPACSSCAFSGPWETALLGPGGLTATPESLKEFSPSQLEAQQSDYVLRWPLALCQAIYTRMTYAPRQAGSPSRKRSQRPVLGAKWGGGVMRAEGVGPAVRTDAAVIPDWSSPTSHIPS